MGRMVPSTGDGSLARGDDPRVLFFDDDRTDEVIAALRSETARELFRTLLRDPSTPSELAEHVDTSVENVSYHLDALAEQDLVAVRDTVYSEKGREMAVYGPSEDPLVLLFGSADEEAHLRATLADLAGVVGPAAVVIALKESLTGLPDPGEWLDLLP